jgi:hypothetical protein
MRPFRVLIIEGDVFLALDLETKLFDLVEADITIATSAAEANEAIERPLDFVFVDFDLPDRKAFDIAGRLLKRAVPLAFVSCSPRQLFPAEMHLTPFIRKPVRSEQVAELFLDGNTVSERRFSMEC